MDSIISAALEEICAQGANGISLQDLFPRLKNSLTSAGLHPCNGVKQAIWNGILKLPGLEFESKGSIFPSRDPSIQSVEESEKLGLKIVAPEHLRDSFVGMYDLKAADAGISAIQRRVLERLAIERTNGITQSQLAKEFGVKGNNIFYIVRNLECQRLVVRQSTIVRTKELGVEGENGMKCNAVVNTNLICLYRYAKHLNLGSQQRLEITKPDSVESGKNADGSNLPGVGGTGDCGKEDMLVKDYLPALKAVCDKLEEVDGKVLVVSDIKQSLGYRKTPGHRAWRNICNRLKDACLVEEFRAEVNKKVVSCLRLLKKFDPKKFQSKTLPCTYDDPDTDPPVKCGKKGQITDQLVELPIEHQIYDMVDAEGSKGITVPEVCRRLGLNNKKNYTRLLNMFSRFGMHLQAESHNRSVQYRVWTAGNFNPDSPAFSPSNCKKVRSKNETPTQYRKDLCLYGQSSSTPLQVESGSKDEFITSDQWKVRGIHMELVPVRESPGNDNNELLTDRKELLELDHEIASTGSDAKLAIMSKADDVPSATSPSKLQVSQRYPCLTVTVCSALREQRVLERLEEEKFILAVELYRWLDDLEKDKPTTMARKTLTRLLKKLQQEGQCKCIQVNVPVVTNCGRSRMIEVVLHPSVESLPPEQIYERMRLIDMQIRGQGLTRLKNDQSVPVLTGVKRTSNRVPSDDPAVRAESMRANGFVPAKMVRAKLLHNFLWGHLSSLPDWDDALSSGKCGYDLENPHSTCNLFAMDAALKAMPFELFLQVVGSAHKFENLVESCRHVLCLSDLPMEEYQHLMNTQATARLSSVIDILRRMKLIRLVTEGQTAISVSVPSAVLTYAMELKPYIEEPLSRTLPTLSVNSSDLRPRIRHDFVLSNRDAVDAYWKTLEYYYAAADPAAALYAYPGSVVHEISSFKAWTSIRVMTADQRAELLKRVGNDDPNKRISFKECVKIARDLNLTLEQVLRVSQDKQRSRLHRSPGDLKSGEADFPQGTKNHEVSGRKRRRSSSRKELKYVKTDADTRDSSRPRMLGLSDDDLKSMDQDVYGQTLTEDLDINMQAYDMDAQAYAREEFGADENGENRPTVSHGAFSRLKSTRRRKFAWTENSDRQLVIQYARHRAALGAKYPRANWASLPDLPAPPDTCRKRMAMLNSNLNIRRAVLKLCNLLSERYAKQLECTQEKESASCADAGNVVQDLSFAKSPTETFDVPENSLKSDSQEYHWDDFEDQNVKLAMDEVLQCKQMAKFGTPKRVGSGPEKEWSDLPRHDRRNTDVQAHNPQEAGLISASNPGRQIHNHVRKRHKSSGMFSSSRRRYCHRLPGKFLKLLNEGVSVGAEEFKSLAVSTAVELLKVVFLSSSVAPGVPTMLAQTLRRYSEHDLFAAFNYLREKKFMVIGQGSSPYVLSQKFWHNASSSPFPTNTGKRAASFASWLHKREKDLIENKINLSVDLQCGEIMHLFALVSCGDIFISPRLPNEGVGEAEETRSLKRKSDREKSLSSEKVKKRKPHWTSDAECYSRREKGFPGLMVSISRGTMSRAEAVEFFKIEKPSSSCSYAKPVHSKSSHDIVTTVIPSLACNLNRWHGTGGSSSAATAPSDETLWEAITSYAEHMTPTPSGGRQEVSFCPELFKDIHMAIHRAGDQGLNMEEVSQVNVMVEIKMAEMIIEMLQVFGLVIKVNAYDCIRAVDASYGSKYLLGTSIDHYQDVQPVSYMKPQTVNEESSIILPQQSNEHGCTLQNETAITLCEGHKVTILDLRNNSDETCDEIPLNDENIRLEDMITSPADSHVRWPILPWLNGDGSLNTIVYKALTRRVLGIMMQNPGTLEDDLVQRMEVLNPQSCRKLLELLVLDNHFTVKEIQQNTSSGPPAILGGIIGHPFNKPVSVCRKHLFANPMSTSLL